MWEYRARCVEVVDGDTVDVEVDVGFKMTRTIRLRLSRVDTHEIHGIEESSEEYRRGIEESQFVRAFLTGRGTEGDWPLIVRTEKKGKYGRYMAEVERRSDGAVLNDVLLDRFDGVASDPD
jgi:micrococcal nuclease